MIVYLIRTAARTAALTAAVLAFGATGPVWAQDATEDETADRLLACDRISDMTEKLACFDAVVQGLKDSPAAPEAASPAASTADPVASPSTEPAATSAPPAAEPAASAPAAEPAASAPAAAAAGAVAAPAAASTTNSAAPATPSPAAAPPEPAATATAETPDQKSGAPAEIPPDPVDEFGRDSMETYVEPEEEAEEEEVGLEAIKATVVRSWINNDGRFSVELDNGQTWRETEGSQTRWQADNDVVFGAPRSATGRQPHPGNTVEISAGRLGSYRMNIEGIRQAARVRRTYSRNSPQY